MPKSDPVLTAMRCFSPSLVVNFTRVPLPVFGSTGCTLDIWTGALLADAATLGALLRGLKMLPYDIDPLDEDLVAAGHDPEDLARLALAVAGPDVDDIAFFDLSRALPFRF